MLGIQVAIGALNDAIDAPNDAVSKPRKPIPSGLVDVRVARGVAGGGALVGLGLSAVSGVATLAVGAACLGLGWLYDLRLSRTQLSWLPLALALPLLPIHAWLGAAGTVPLSLLGLVPVGVLAGAGLALANGLVDIERDAGTRRAALVVTLGRRRAWLVQTALLAIAAAIAAWLAPWSGSAGGELANTLVAIRRWGIVAGCAALGVGAAVLASGRAGIGWLAGTSALGGG